MLVSIPAGDKSSPMLTSCDAEAPLRFCPRQSEDCPSAGSRGMILQIAFGSGQMPIPQLAPVLVADSITRVGVEAAGAVVVNASHGGIYAAYVAAKFRVAAAVFNDAGVGRDAAGIAGLDYLARLGVPAAAVGHMTARIGDGSDMVERGVITYANAPATALGCTPGMICRDALAALQSASPGAREPPPAPARAKASEAASGE